MKVLALDLGDAWTGSALSDPLRMFAKPHQTFATSNLQEALSALFATQQISTVIVGLPKTMKGTNSAQTEKIIAHKEELEKLYPDKLWILWDERLTSKQAAKVAPAKNKEQKRAQHSIAAAVLLESYLLSLSC